MSTPANDSGLRRRTVSSSPRYESVWPSLRSEASGTSSDTGNSRSSSTFNISLPTATFTLLIRPSLPSLAIPCHRRPVNHSRFTGKLSLTQQLHHGAHGEHGEI